jgi:hypothetical protein
VSDQEKNDFSDKLLAQHAENFSPVQMGLTTISAQIRIISRQRISNFGSAKVAVETTM